MMNNTACFCLSCAPIFNCYYLFISRTRFCRKLSTSGRGRCSFEKWRMLYVWQGKKTHTFYSFISNWYKICGTENLAGEDLVVYNRYVIFFLIFFLFEILQGSLLDISGKSNKRVSYHSIFNFPPQLPYHRKKMFGNNAVSQNIPFEAWSVLCSALIISIVSYFDQHIFRVLGINFNSVENRKRAQFF